MAMIQNVRFYLFFLPVIRWPSLMLPKAKSRASCLLNRQTFSNNSCLHRRTIKMQSSWTQKHILRNIASQPEPVSSSTVTGCHWGQGNEPYVFTFCKWVIRITNSHSFTVNHCGQMQRNSHAILDDLLIQQIPPPAFLPSFKIQLKHCLYIFTAA